MTAIWSSYDGGQDYSSGTKEDQADLKEPLTEFAPGCTNHSLVWEFSVC